MDWAIDVSDADLHNVEIMGIPGRLIRRDPKWQVTLTRSHVATCDWSHIAFLTGNRIPNVLADFVDFGEEYRLLSVPKNDEQGSHDINLLVEHGIADQVCM